MGHGACVPTISAALDLLVDLHVLPNKLLSGFVYFPLSGSQLLHPYVRWGRCSPFGSITEVACHGGLLHGGAFDVSLGGTRHETFLGGVMAPPAGVRARVQPRLLCEEAMEQGHRGGDVLARPGEARKGFIIDDDPLVHVTGPGARAHCLYGARASCVPARDRVMLLRALGATPSAALPIGEVGPLHPP